MELNWNTLLGALVGSALALLRPYLATRETVPGRDRRVNGDIETKKPGEPGFREYQAGDQAIG
jgi:hypothetical protein